MSCYRVCTVGFLTYPVGLGAFSSEGSMAYSRDVGFLNEAGIYSSGYCSGVTPDSLSMYTEITKKSDELFPITMTWRDGKKDYG